MNLHVLVVEDNPLNAELTRDLLELHGHVVHLVGSGAALREKISAGLAADIVLMDIHLPDAAGAALLRELRAIPRFQNVRVIALTAHALSGDVTEFLQQGFDGVLTKPIDTRSFVSEIERWAKKE